MVTKGEKKSVWYWIFLIVVGIMISYYVSDFLINYNKTDYCVDDCVQDNYDCLMSYYPSSQTGVSMLFLDALGCVDDLESCVEDCGR